MIIKETAEQQKILTAAEIELTYSKKKDVGLFVKSFLIEEWMQGSFTARRH
ncbi:hypothetical protein [Planococcus shixiaomingii]|uniref:hypothetical protein n=1 Tax=Planococcus shixiaomingii TaxID=3058393 RepID=UPI002614AD23|nr:hypothetical protein [Planococcus sp. N022]WKA54463.1 hypothetical protein QWY21_17595 [Planococcus sp. N022]